MKKQSPDYIIARKHLCLDARMYKHSGIGVYLLELIEELKNDPQINLTLLVPHANIPEFYMIPQILFNAPIYSVKEQLLFPFVIPNCDIFWSPHYNVPILPVKARKRWVTIHDVYHLRFSQYLSLTKRIYARICFSTACRLSEKIFTVSNFSAAELQTFYDVQHKIEIRYNKINAERFSKKYSQETIYDILKKYEINFPYILFVGNVKPHKNLITLLKAYNKIRKLISPAKLVIVGKKEGFITEDNEVKRYLDINTNLQAYIKFTDTVEHSELPVLYQQAKLFVFPSLYEGFGYPPIEALAAGTKVLCSNAGPMPEVCGNKVDYFDPNDADELGRLICDKLSDF